MDKINLRNKMEVVAFYSLSFGQTETCQPKFISLLNPTRLKLTLFPQKKPPIILSEQILEASLLAQYS